MILVFSSVLFLQGIYTLNRIKYNQGDEFIVFNKSRTSLISRKIANTVTFYSKDTLIEKEHLVKGYSIGNFVKTIQINNLQGFHYSNHKKILIIDSAVVYDQKIRPDVLLLVGSPKINLERILQDHKPEVIIADASNYKNYVQQWKQTSKKHKIRFHSTYENGFYRLGN